MNIKQYSSNQIIIEITDEQNNIVNIKDIKSVLFSATGSKNIATRECIKHYDTSKGTLVLPLSAEDRDTLGGYQASIELISDTEHYIATANFVIVADNIPELKVAKNTTPTISVMVDGWSPHGKVTAVFLSSPLAKQQVIKGTVKWVKDAFKVKLSKADTKNPGEQYLALSIGAQQASLIKLIIE